jgi:hypothetical protein
MNKPSRLSAAIRNRLAHIEPSIGMGGADTAHYPCMAILKSGKEIPCVCLVERNLYMHTWGLEPHDDPHKKSVRVEDVASVASSASRLPPAFANRLYASAESGMGYHVFIVQFRNGSARAYLLGNLIDFIDYPEGQGPDDVVNVLPHQGRESNPASGPEYVWCLYDE